MQSSTLKTFTVILSLVFVYAVNSSYAADMSPDSSKPVTEQLVDTMTQLAHGPYAGFRANHAKGIMTIRKFIPAAGVPNLPDADPNASPHGMAIRFTLPDGSETDIVSISANGFPASTPEEFLGFLNAVAASGPGAPKPTPIEQFLGTHPAAQKFAATPRPAPASFATLAFYGVNAFRFTNAKGESRYGRYRIMPAAGEHSLTEQQAAKASPNYLMDELPARLKKGKVKFNILVQLAEKDDVINDDTVVWPDSRSLVKLGTLSLDKVLPNSAEMEKTFMYSPLNLTDGIDASDDPILNARPAAYAISFGRRFGGGT